jgi:predicted NBD/HSP70 family sugar kinase
LTGLARSTVAQRVDALLATGLVAPAGGAVSSGGRPPSRFRFDAGSRAVLAADVGATHVRVAVTDLAARVLRAREDDLDIAQGPQVVLDHVVEQGRRLLAAEGVPLERLAGVGLGLPGPVEHATGRPTHPPIMPGWDGYDVVAHLETALGRVAAVDNDVNVMALGEHFTTWPGVQHLVFVKASTGIGLGIISGGTLHRGAQGAAGDLGHVQVPQAQDVRCRCGNHGCLEAVAGGAALVARLAQQGAPVATSRDLALLARSGDAGVVQVLREAGRRIGAVLADVVSLLNPSVIVLGGALTTAGEHLVAGVRETVYQRSLPLATQHLRIEPSRTGDSAGVVGAAVLVIERVLDPVELDRLV